MKKLFIFACAGLLPFLATARPGDYVPRKVSRPAETRSIINKTNPPPAAIIESASITNKLNPDWLKTPTEPFTLGPGDKIEIEIMDDVNIRETVESRQVVTVGPDGKIYFSILPGIDVWGMTLTQTKEVIENELGKFFRDKPIVGLTLRAIESKKVWLLGRFQQPGPYPMAGPVTLIEALSTAGGALSYTSTGQQETSLASNAEELADLRRAFIVRNGELIPVDFERLMKQGDLSQNVYVQPDDLVYLPAARSREVYVIGAVNDARAIPYQDGMTLVSAIANASGTFKESRIAQVAIVRGSMANPHIAMIDYKKIIQGHAADVPLEPHDIIHVPLKPYRHLVKYAELIMNTFVTTLAINEGARAVNQNTAPTGVVIPLGSTITVTAPVSIPIR